MDDNNTPTEEQLKSLKRTTDNLLGIAAEVFEELNSKIDKLSLEIVKAAVSVEKDLPQ